MGKEIIYADRKDFTLVTSDIKVVFGKRKNFNEKYSIKKLHGIIYAF